MNKKKTIKIEPQKIQMVKVDELIPYVRNPRSHPDEQIYKLARIIKEIGFKGAILVDKHNEIIAGHGRLLAAKKLGLDKVPVIIDATITPAQAKALRIADNKIGEESAWINEYLSQEMIELEDINFDLELTGYGFDEFQKIRIRDDQENEDEIVPPIKKNKKPISKTGTLWELGEHRLLCGDATKIKDFEKLMDGKKADMVFTDPPYGVSYGTKNLFLNKIDKGNIIQTPIQNDQKSELQIQALWKTVFEMIRDNLAPVNSYYITGPQIQGMMMMMMMMQEAGLPYRHVIIWVKNNHVLGRSDYNYKHEPLFFGWTSKHKFYGNGPFQTSVWEVAKPHKSDLHPTMKPVALIENAILNSSAEGQIILDPFLGSGSTLIACEKLNRKCYGMEIDPYYCDVIVKRWEDFTGRKAVKIK